MDNAKKSLLAILGLAFSQARGQNPEQPRERHKSLEGINIDDAFECVESAFPDLMTTGQYEMLMAIGEKMLDKASYDIVPIVRCGRCRYMLPEIDPITGKTVGYLCEKHDIHALSLDGFCNYGEETDGGADNA